MRLLALLPVTSILACGTPGASDTAKSDTADTGTPDENPYEGDPGCINVDNTGDYPSISEAVVWAADGSTISVCAGTYTESVAVTKAVAIVAETGTVIEGASNLPAFDITATGASVSGFTVHSTRSGITVGAVDGVVLADLVIEDVANWGIETDGATGLQLVDSQITGAAYGGVYVNGGDLSASGSTFAELDSYGINANKGDVHVDSCVFDSIYLIGDSDGVAVNSVKGDVSGSGNTFVAMGLAAYLVDGGALVSAGDTIDDALYGVVALDGALTLSDVVITGALYMGVYGASNTDPLVVSNASVTVDPTSAVSLTYDEFAQQTLGGGILLASPTVELTNSEVTGYNNFGVIVGPYSSGQEVALTLDGLTITGVSRIGLQLNTTFGTADNVTITGLIEPEMEAPCKGTNDSYSYSVDRSAALLLFYGEVSMTGLVSSGNDGWGISNYANALSLTGATIASNTCSGIIDYTGTLTITDSTFTDSSSAAGIWEYGGVLNVSGTTFYASHTNSVYYYDDYTTGEQLMSVTSGGAVDITIASSPSSTISGNTFLEGDNAIQTQDSTVSITDNSFTSYTRYIVSSSNSTSDPVVNFERNTLDQIQYYALAASYGTIVMRDIEVLSQSEYNYETTTYWTADGSVYSSSTFSSYAPLINAYASDLEIDTLTTGPIVGDGINFSDSSVVLKDVSIGTGARYGIYGYWYSYAPDLEMSNVTLTDAAYYGINLFSYVEGGYIDISGLTVGETGYESLYVSDIDELFVDDAQLGPATSNGMTLYSIGAAEITDVDIAAAGTNGLYVYDSNVLLEGVSAVADGDDGLDITLGTATIVGNSFTGNGGYGMRCSGTTLTECLENDLSGNVAGEHSGCNDACSVDYTGGEDTGGGDTGGGDTAVVDTGA